MGRTRFVFVRDRDRKGVTIRRIQTEREIHVGFVKVDGRARDWMLAQGLDPDRYVVGWEGFGYAPTLRNDGKAVDWYDVDLRQLRLGRRRDLSPLEDRGFLIGKATDEYESHLQTAPAEWRDG